MGTGKPRRKAATLRRTRRGGASGVTHASLDARLIHLGQVVATRGLNPARRPADAHSRGVETILKDPASLASRSVFGRRYRAIQPGQDELVSTSAVRGLMQGAMRVGPRDFKSLVAAFAEVSRLRVPTAYTGYALGTQTMQHPTAAATAFFANPATTASQHARDDLQRKAEVVSAMEAASRNPRSGGDEILRAGRAAGILHTMNTMMAPASASNVAKNLSGRTPAQIAAQVAERETLKPRGVAAGLKLERGDQSRREPWEQNRQRRSLSPPRSRP